LLRGSINPGAAEITQIYDKMSYNHRMSQQFHGTQQQRKGRKKEDENDALMRLVSPLPPYDHSSTM
jgi:hypothetical protein